MRKPKVLVAAIGLMVSMSITAFAGEWKQDAIGWWYENDDGSYPASTWFQDTDGKWYYFNEHGYMITNATISGEFKVDSNGVCTNSTKLAKAIAPAENYENTVEDTLPFLYNGEIAETSCRIYYDNYRYGTYTTVRYDSAYIQEWNGKNTNLIINYTAEKTDRYKATYFGCDVYVNGEKLTSLGGKNGNERMYFNQNVTSVFIPTETFKPGDLIELHING